MSAQWVAAGEGAMLVVLIAVCAVIWRVDMRRMIIPDSASLILLASGLLYSWLAAGAPATGGFTRIFPVEACVSASALGLGFFFFSQGMSLALRREALGLGDVKTAFGVGAWMSLEYTLLYVLVTSAVSLTTFVWIVTVRFFRPMRGRPDAPAGAGRWARFKAAARKRVRPPRAFPYGPAMAAALVVVVIAERADLLFGPMGLGPVFAAMP